MNDALAKVQVEKMQVKQFQGLWYFYDAKDNKVYAYEKEPTSAPLWLGAVNPQTGSVTLRADWKDAYAVKLTMYRQTEKPKSRVPVAPTQDKN